MASTSGVVRSADVSECLHYTTSRPSSYTGTLLISRLMSTASALPFPLSPLLCIENGRVLQCVSYQHIATDNTGQEVTVFGGANVSIDTTNWHLPGPQSPGHSLSHSMPTTTSPSYYTLYKLLLNTMLF